MSDESVFAAALAIARPADRAAFLEKACAGNPGLRREVEALLSAHAADNVLDRPPGDLIPTGDYEPPAGGAGVASVGDSIGPYRLMEQIGEGGFGLVFVAEQTEPVRRKVALKVLKPGMDTRDVVARFEAERQALALMDHPNIARVLDAGSTPAGRPYFVMELVRGVPVTDFCDAHKLGPADRLTLFVQVCQAVQHAHQKGVIHRDLKPSNVLVTMIDGKPVPKVIDFGVAKAVGQSLTDRTIYTRFAQVLGTPLYMSPEQAEMSGVDVDTRADVYALGVLLYELLTGTTPFDRDRFRKAAFDEIRRILREEDPPRPSTRLSSLGATLTEVSARRGTEPAKLTGMVRGELDWIVMKCLEKDRNRRYETANGLARDVQRFLGGEAVEACPPTLRYRLRKLYRRHRAAVWVGGLILGLTYAGACGVYFAYRRAVNAEARLARERNAALASEARAVDATRAAEAERDNAARANATLRQLSDRQRRTLYASEMNLAQAAWESGDARRTVELLRHWVPKPGEPDLRGFEWHYWNRQAHQETRRVRLEGLTDEERARGVVGALSPDGTRVAAGVSDHLDDLDTLSSSLGVWDTASGRLLWRGPAVLGDLLSCEFSGDGRRLLSWVMPWNAGEEPLTKVEALVWQVEDGTLVYRTGAILYASSHGASLSSDGERLAIDVYEENGQATANRIIRLSDGQELARMPVEGDVLDGLVFSVCSDPDRPGVIVYERSRNRDRTRLVMRDREDGRLIWDFDLTGDRMVRDARFLPGGERLAFLLGNSLDEMERVVLLDARDGHTLATYQVPETPRFLLSGGSSLAAVGSRLAVRENRRMLVMDLDQSAGGPGTSSLAFQLEADVMAIALVADGSGLLNLDRRGVVREHDLRPKPPLKLEFVKQARMGGRRFQWFRSPSKPEAYRLFEFDGMIEVGSEQGPRIIDISGKEVGDRLPPLPPGHTHGPAEPGEGPIRSTLWHPTEGECLLVVWDLAAARQCYRIPLGPGVWYYAAVAPDGKSAALVGDSQTQLEPGLNRNKPWQAKVVDLVSGRVVWSSQPDGDSRGFFNVTFDHDGRHIVFTCCRSLMSNDGAIVWYDAKTMTETAQLRTSGALSFQKVCFSSDGSLIAINSRLSSMDSFGALVFPVTPILRGETPEPLYQLTGSMLQFSQMAFSLDGTRLMATNEGRLRLWETAHGAEVLSLALDPLGIPSPLFECSFSPDGHHIWAGLDEEGKLWGLDATPLPDEVLEP